MTSTHAFTRSSAAETAIMIGPAVFCGMQIFMPRCGIWCLLQNLLLATEKRGIALFSSSIYNSGFLGSF